MNAPFRTFPQPVKLTVADYLVLAEAGTFAERRSVELVEGALLEMNPQRRRHAHAKTELGYRISRCLRASGSPLGVLIDCTLALPPHSAPEPDIIVTSAPRGEGYATVQTTALAVEVGDSTVAYDLEEKSLLYARHLVPEYWVVALPEQAVHLFWSSDGLCYLERRIVLFGETLASATIDKLSVATDGLI